MAPKRFLSQCSLQDLWMFILAAILVMLVVGCAGSPAQETGGELIDRAIATGVSL